MSRQRLWLYAVIAAFVTTLINLGAASYHVAKSRGENERLRVELRRCVGAQAEQTP